MHHPQTSTLLMSWFTNMFARHCISSAQSNSTSVKITRNLCSLWWKIWWSTVSTMTEQLPSQRTCLLLAITRIGLKPALLAHPPLCLLGNVTVRGRNAEASPHEAAQRTKWGRRAATHIFRLAHVSGTDLFTNQVTGPRAFSGSICTLLC